MLDCDFVTQTVAPWHADVVDAIPHTAAYNLLDHDGIGVVTGIDFTALSSERESNNMQFYNWDAGVAVMPRPTAMADDDIDDEDLEEDLDDEYLEEDLDFDDDEIDEDLEEDDEDFEDDEFDDADIEDDADFEDDEDSEDDEDESDDDLDS